MSTRRPSPPAAPDDLVLDLKILRYRKTLRVIEALERFVLIVGVGLLCLVIAAALCVGNINHDGAPPKPAKAERVRVDNLPSA